MNLTLVLDPWIIPLYRMTGEAGLDYVIGTFVLAVITVVVGEFTISLALRLNAGHLSALERELDAGHRLSLAALEWGDARGYRACNRQANDTFGRYFFVMIAHSAALLWPVPLALAWMQSRFHEVVFEFCFPVSLVWPTTGYFTTFFLAYVLARILFKNIRRYLPYFRSVQKMLDTPRAPEPLVNNG
jgi:hypothetical protein